MLDCSLFIIQFSIIINPLINLKKIFFHNVVKSFLIFSIHFWILNICGMLNWRGPQSTPIWEADLKCS